MKNEITKVIFLNKHTNWNIEIAKEKFQNLKLWYVFIWELIEFNKLIK